MEKGGLFLFVLYVKGGYASTALASREACAWYAFRPCVRDAEGSTPWRDARSAADLFVLTV
ncbi:MAG: hypothetical protein QW039_03290 [Fervidicoccaceae archaeon]